MSKDVDALGICQLLALSAHRSKLSHSLYALINGCKGSEKFGVNGSKRELFFVQARLFGLAQDFAGTSEGKIDVRLYVLLAYDTTEIVAHQHLMHLWIDAREDDVDAL